jgi:hypothetical protein
MPRISEFYGIVIYMYPSDHGLPHFHARYSGCDCSVSIKTGTSIAGVLPPRIHRLVRQWVNEHRAELYANWERACNEEALKPIAPLK